MTDIKFIGTNQVELVNSLDESNKISPTQVGENFIEFSFNSLSKDSDDFYHFQISGSNVQVSGQITEVHNDYQFFNLFAGSEAITDASELILSAPTAKKFCYANMFLDCTNLTTPPVISATALDEWCYSSMFGNCSSLTSVPDLPATTLARYCYYCMFYGCKSLSSAPYLSAQTLQDWCYNSMFYECQKLTSISAEFNSWGENATTNWVTGIKTEGKFYDSNVAEIYGVDNVPQTWQYDYSKTPLTFVAKEDNSTIKLEYTLFYEPTISYKLNDNQWEVLEEGNNTVLTLNTGDKVAFSGDLSAQTQSDNLRYFMTGSFDSYGNVQSLINWSQTCGDYRFYGLFSGCTALKTAPLLAATSVGNSAYKNMFKRSGLSTAPDLPATGLNQSCYQGMFSSCSSLVTAPSIIPATTTAPSACFGMFEGCTALTSVPDLPATGLAELCYHYMFNGCSKLSTAMQILPATTLAPYCYQQMFRQCTNLIHAPKLPATETVNACYRWMFESCTNLQSIDVNFTVWADPPNAVPKNTFEWVHWANTSSTGKFYKPAALEERHGVSWIPSNWQVINKDINT